MKKKPERQDRRTTISLAAVVWDWAQEMMRLKGFNDNISAYVADLIRRDKERQEQKTGAIFPKRGPERLELNETAPPAREKKPDH
jgi:hypothetical protein